MATPIVVDIVPDKREAIELCEWIHKEHGYNAYFMQGGIAYAFKIGYKPIEMGTLSYAVIIDVNPPETGYAITNAVALRKQRAISSEGER